VGDAGCEGLGAAPFVSCFLRQHDLVQVLWVFLSLPGTPERPLQYNHDQIKQATDAHQRLLKLDHTQTFNSDRTVILVGGGDIDWERLEYAIGMGHPIIAVDSGADALRDARVRPDVIIGDMDSISDIRGWTAPTRVAEIPEQDTTDFEKALYATSAPLYLAFGFFGQRLDHSLTALHCLTKYRTLKSIVLIDLVDLMFAPTVPLTIDLPRNSRFSINPLAPVTFLSSTGLQYPLDGLTLEAGVATGTSNKVTGATVSVIPEYAERADYQVVVPNSLLRHVLKWYSSL